MHSGAKQVTRWQTTLTQPRGALPLPLKPATAASGVSGAALGSAASAPKESWPQGERKWTNIFHSTFGDGSLWGGKMTTLPYPPPTKTEVIQEFAVDTDASKNKRSQKYRIKYSFRFLSGLTPNAQQHMSAPHNRTMTCNSSHPSTYLKHSRALTSICYFLRVLFPTLPNYIGFAICTTDIAAHQNQKMPRPQKGINKTKKVKQDGDKS